MVDFPQKPNGLDGCGKTMVLMPFLVVSALIRRRKNGGC